MRRKKKEHVIDILGYIVFYGFFNVLKALPGIFYPVISKITGYFFYYSIPSLRKKIKKNLDAAYEGCLSQKQKKRLIKKIIEKQVFFFTEWALWAKMEKQKALGLVEFDNIHPLKKVVFSKKPVVIVSAHIGNFAVMIAALTYIGLPLTWIARDANNEYLARFMDRTRKKKGIFGISKKNLYQAIAESSLWLKKGNSLCLLIDQHSGRGTNVLFFGKKVQAPTGPAIFARKYDAMVFGAFIQHLRGFKHKIFIEGPYEIVKTNNSEQDIRENTQFFYKRIEHYIKQKPEEWFTWLHRRFR
ncbi:MAG: lysophospholipid acyltransferase family protein [Candidatus Omnitrophica bacterium]|nr:lysophospholipid acyltransferase family protein [Candidatus Omnitrophota bacterium]MCM8816613.1 lysophospholipid acyltransferase family protein [Candidatus Omnitrophota bacterium]